MYITGNLQSKSGVEMLEENKLAEAAAIVSQWLQTGAPHTNPKPQETLVEQMANSTYLTVDGEVVGHANFKYLGSVSMDIKVEDELVCFVPMAHFAIESLVVKTDLTGFGIGSIALAETINAAKSATPENKNWAAVSAAASKWSLGLFLSEGFKDAGNYVIDLGYKMETALNKKIVYKAMNIGQLW